MFTIDATIGEPVSRRPALRAARLAELVQHLTDCPPEGALAAVAQGGPSSSPDQALELVARAMVAVRRDRSAGA